ncbi:MAG TPA: pyruvoyl-dependent arginine decarboxylase [Mycobacteriales bacterium]|jgi:arginine decarboxylase|nr:pyruvoyl-dependent arginine decarboxylase [Mycobacteriales bacterium]
MTSELILPDVAPARLRTRTIEIACGTGTGPNTLAAFDGALRATGIANFNLLRLSSVIPPETEVRAMEGPVSPIIGEWGDRLYVVMAEQRVTEPGAEAWAGIGWVQNAETGKGLFVEHEGHDEGSVRGDILDSLGALVEGRPDETFGEPNFVLHGAVCDGTPTCALAVAVYETAPWSIDLTGCA